MCAQLPPPRSLLCRSLCWVPPLSSLIDCEACNYAPIMNFNQCSYQLALQQGGVRSAWAPVHGLAPMGFLPAAESFFRRDGCLKVPRMVLELARLWQVSQSLPRRAKPHKWPFPAFFAVFAHTRWLSAPSGPEISPWGVVLKGRTTESWILHCCPVWMVSHLWAFMGWAWCVKLGVSALLLGSRRCSPSPELQGKSKVLSL